MSDAGNTSGAGKDAYDAALNPVLSQHGDTMPLEKAFITILTGAVYADEKVRAVEIMELEALMARVSTLKAMSAQDRRQACDEIYPLVKDARSRRDRVKLACASVLAAKTGKQYGPGPKDKIDEAIFSHACDLICTDLHVPKKEKDFLRDLARDLRLDETRAQMIMNTLILKNRH